MATPSCSSGAGNPTGPPTALWYATLEAIPSPIEATTVATKPMLENVIAPLAPASVIAELVVVTVLVVLVVVAVVVVTVSQHLASLQGPPQSKASAFGFCVVRSEQFPPVVNHASHFVAFWQHWALLHRVSPNNPPQPLAWSA